MKQLTILICAYFCLSVTLWPAYADNQPATPAIQASLISLDYVNAPVGDVLRALAAQEHVNVAMSVDPNQKVSVRLSNKSLEQAFQLVANLAGLECRRVDHTFLIAPPSEMKAMIAKMGVSRSVTLDHLKPNAASQLVNADFPLITTKNDGSSITLIGTPSDVSQAVDFISTQDRMAADAAPISMELKPKHVPTAQLQTALAKLSPNLSVNQVGDALLISGDRSDVMNAYNQFQVLDQEGATQIEYRVYEVRYSSADELTSMLKQAFSNLLVIPGPQSYAPPAPHFQPLSGQSLGGGVTGGSSGGGFGGGMGGGGSSGGAHSSSSNSNSNNKPGVNSLSLILEGTPEDVNAALKLLKQVDVPPQQVMIDARVIDTSPEEISNMGVSWTWGSQTLQEHGGSDYSSIPANTVLRSLGFGSFGRTPFDATATINAMIEHNKAKLLADPRIAVLNNQGASIFIGDTLRFNTLATSSPTTGNQFTVYEVPVGIVLLVRPRVNTDGYITLHVHPVVSTITGFTDGLPQTASREAETTVRVKNGQTIVIGGLIQDQDIRTMSKIPILGDLPIIGSLFKSISKDHRHSEVVVFLTPHLMKQ